MTLVLCDLRFFIIWVHVVICWRMYLVIIYISFYQRKRPNNMTDDELADKLRMLLHFRGTGNATDKEYQELNDVYSFESNANAKLKVSNVVYSSWSWIMKTSITCSNVCHPSAATYLSDACGKVHCSAAMVCSKLSTHRKDIAVRSTTTHFPNPITIQKCFPAFPSSLAEWRLAVIRLDSRFFLNLSTANTLERKLQHTAFEWVIN